MKKFTLIVLSIALLLGSCSIENRHYKSGYFVQWKNNKKEIKQQTNVSQNKSTVLNNNKTVEKQTNEPIAINNNTPNNDINNNEILIASTDNSIIPLTSTKTNSYVNKQNSSPTVEKNTSNNKTDKRAIVSNKKVAKKAVKPKGINGGGKSQIVALLLCIFVGFIGIHRFYLGYVGIGIAQILTAGGCGIWTLIDLIRICTGDLKPKNGDYDKTF